MIDKNKYLYWMKDEQNIEQELVYREMYSRIGFIFHLIQMVEYNLANILAIEEFEKEESLVFSKEQIKEIKKRVNKTYKKLVKKNFGDLAKIAKRSQYLKDLDFDFLKSVVTYRNYLAHECFKEKLLEKKLENINDADAFVDELNNYESVMINLNNWLVDVFKDNKKKSILMWK